MEGPILWLSCFIETMLEMTVLGCVITLSAKSAVKDCIATRRSEFGLLNPIFSLPFSSRDLCQNEDQV